jgi:hypothetical protein
VKSLSHQDSVWIKLVSAKASPQYFCFLYRPPPSDDSYLDGLEKDIAAISLESPKSDVCIIGDFNVHHSTWLGSNNTDSHGINLLNFCAVNDFHQLVSGPTRFPPNSLSRAQLLDLFLTNSKFHADINCRVIGPIGNSDHSCVAADLKVHDADSSSSGQFVWKESLRLSKPDWDGLRQFFSSFDWTHCQSSADDYFKHICDTIKAGISLFIPSRKVLIKAKSPPWYSPASYTATSKKQQAFRVWRRDPNDKNHEAYRKARNQAKNAIRSAKQSFCATIGEKVAQNGADRSFWGTVSSIFGKFSAAIPPLRFNNSVCSDNSQKAEIFASIFASNSTISEKTSELPDFPSQTSSSLTQVHFHPKEVRKILHNLRDNAAPGPDEIPAVVLKECAPELAPVLTKFFIFCFASATVPQAWKVHKVIPVHKKGSKSDPANYRPISLTSIIGKCMETVVNRQIVSHLDSHHLLSDCQYGFRKGRSTADLLTLLTARWSEAMERHGETRVISLDISEAFDRVWHSGLLHKLSAYGIKGPLLSWVTDYLKDRRLFVRVGDKSSGLHLINAGVPQGSVLGPTLFLIFINDIFNSTCSSIHSFADDTTLHASFTFDLPPSGEEVKAERQRVAGQITHDLRQVSDWGKRWRVSFNPDKTEQIVVTRKRDRSELPTVSFNDCDLPVHRTTRLLGVTIDDGLLWSDHIIGQCKRAASMLGCLCRAKRLIPAKQLSLVYKAKIRPLLEYCSSAWCSASESSLHPLDMIERRAGRIIGPEFRVPYSLSTRRTVGGLAFIHKLIGGQGSDELRSLLPPPEQQPGRRLRSESSRNCFRLRAQTCRTEHHRRSFFPRFVELWNCLPDCLADPSISATAFKAGVSRKPP